MVRKRLTESTIQEVSSYLKGQDLLSEISEEFGDNKDSKEVCEYVLEKCEDKFEDVVMPKVSRVVVMKSDGDDFTTVDSNHYAVMYDGNFYDYTATDFSDIFSISESDLPIIQPILSSDKLVSKQASSVRGYVLLMYR